MLTAEHTVTETCAVELVSRRAGHTAGPGEARSARPGFPNPS